MAVIELIGKRTPLDGKALKISLKSNMHEPINIHAGISNRWFADWNIKRDKCGTIIPTNPIGPQNAVVIPAKRPLAKITIKRILLTEIPILKA